MNQRFYGLNDRRRKLNVVSELQDQLRSAILEAGLSNRELARRTGYDKSTISNLLSGKREGSLNTWSDMLQAAGVVLETRSEV